MKFTTVFIMYNTKSTFITRKTTENNCIVMTIYLDFEVKL